MNIQEILNNLASLEKELQNIKSARTMAEETIRSYRDTQKEIANLIEGLSQVDASLISIAEELKKQDVALSERIRQAIGKIDQELSSISRAFKSNCDKSNVSFSESIGNVIENLRHEIGEVTGAFAQSNATFGHHLEELGALRDSIATTDSDMKEIKIAIETFQKQVESSFTKQDQAFAGINRDCTEITAKLKNIEDREKAAEDKLQHIESFIADDIDIRKSNYGRLQRSLKNIQIYLVITLILLIFSVVYPFAIEFVKI